MLRVRTHPEAEGRMLQHPQKQDFTQESGTWQAGGKTGHPLQVSGDLDIVGCRCLQKGLGLGVRMAFASFEGPMDPDCKP